MQKGCSYAVVQNLTKQSELSVITMDSFGRFPLHWACGHRDTSVETVHHLLEIYPQAAIIRDDSDQTPVELAQRCKAHPRIILELSMAQQRLWKGMWKLPPSKAKRRGRPIKVVPTSKYAMDDISCISSRGVSQYERMRYVI